jgi:hypothetical protein
MKNYKSEGTSNIKSAHWSESYKEGVRQTTSSIHMVLTQDQMLQCLALLLHITKDAGFNLSLEGGYSG